MRKFLLKFLLTLSVFISLSNYSNSQIVISQVYGGGGNSGATYTHDFIELFNRGTSAVSIAGWSIQYTSSAGTTWQKTDLSGIRKNSNYFYKPAFVKFAKLCYDYSFCFSRSGMNKFEHFVFKTLYNSHMAYNTNSAIGASE